MADEKVSGTDPVWSFKEFKALQEHADEINKLHLKQLLSSANKNVKDRNSILTVKTDDGIILDCTRQRATKQTLDNLITLANKCNIASKVESMFNGTKINRTENRSVLHVALRAKRTDKIIISNDDNKVNVVDNVYSVLDKIDTFSKSVRSGEFKGYSGSKIKNVISIGIGGSYLGAEFVFEALKTDPTARKNAQGRNLKFYANIDPIGFGRATAGLDAKETLCIVVSKSFTTRETMMNAELIRNWLLSAYNGDTKCLSSHFIAVSANPSLPVEKFGVDKNNIFEFWDWVGGRYSVSSAVGILPLSIHYGFDVMNEFLKGANNIDCHFKNNLHSKEAMCSNIPLMMGLFGIWNCSFLKYPTRALIPYCEALGRLPAHIQQLDMESNGKRIDLNGNAALKNNCSGEINFGEPGTNAQHSFFQLMHQGRVVPVDLIAFCKSQLAGDNELYSSAKMKELIESNHDELISNFFAQCDALAIGKTAEEVRKELESKNMKKEEMEYILEHKVFDGNRPSSLLLFDGYLNAYRCGQILSIFEHRTVVQGFVWNVGSFDQWGVQLGKLLAKNIRKQIDSAKQSKNDDGSGKFFDEFNTNTQDLLAHYAKNSK